MAEKTQRVMWTVLPDGFSADGAQLRLSVLVGPELILGAAVTPPELSQFPDFLDWPARLAGARFELELGFELLPLTLVSAPESATWAAMFPPDTYVIPRAFEDRRGTHVLSYPAMRLHDHLAELYARLAFETADARPRLPDLRVQTRFLGDRVPRPREVLDIVRDNGIKGLMASDLGAYALHETFHTPLEREETATYVKQGPSDPRENATWRTHRLATLPKDGDFKQRIDFHRIVSAMNQHRGLLRALGLVLDFETPRDAAPLLGAAQPARLRVEWPATAEDETGVETLPDRLPITRTLLDDQRFQAAPAVAGALFAGRLLPLGDERFRLIQLDLDGSAIKFRNLARNLATMRAEALEEDEETKEKVPARIGAPALRSAGLTLIEIGRGERLADAFERSGALHDAASANVDVELTAEDLVRGLHVDIHDERTGRWQSLCRRDARYLFVHTAATRSEEDQEGMVRLGATASADGENPDIVKLPENSLSWTGWSLAAPPVGLAVEPDDDQPQQLDNMAPAGLPLETTLSVRPGSLPSLRFGRTYRMRARVVDLAHNALPPDQADLPGQGALETSPPQTYRRFEPVESPALALVEGAGGIETPRAGESMARLAIRSFNATPDLNSVASTEVARRHVFAPRATVKLCETHGALDGPDGRLDPASFPLLEARDQDLPRIVLTAPDSGVPAPNPDDPVATRSLPRYAHAPEGFALGHLPDPLAEGVLLRTSGLPLPADQAEVSVPYYPDGAWPDAQPFEIVLREDGPLSVKFDESERRLFVSLPKAEVLRIRLSHRLAEGALELLGVWDWMRRRFGGQVAPALEALAEAGRHWMLTPDREIRLYHPVQKPLVTPEFLVLTAGRAPLRLVDGKPVGNTDARISGRTPVHAKSTEKLDLAGRWNEASDPLAEPGPLVRPASGAAGEQKLRRLDAPGGLTSFSFRHDFGDTRYRRVTYRMDATTRFREFMPEPIRSDPAQLMVGSAPGVAWVPNGAPPPAPEVLYVVPTFGWSRSRPPDGRYRAFRDGGGLRVYLARPWLVSGAAEMLAVVLPPANATLGDIEGRLKPFVTQWGADPIWGPARPPSAAPARSAFPLRREAGPLPAGTLVPDLLPEEENDLRPGSFALEGLRSPDLPSGSSVAVVPHVVDWDPERRLWYADIVVEPGTVYSPFIRLALARYQPISIEGAHLSTIVLADFAQLTPDRLVTVTPRGGREHEVAIFGVGYGQAGGAPGSTAAASPLFEVEVQAPTGDAGDELGWRAARGAKVTVARRRASATAGAAATASALLSGAARIGPLLGLGGDSPAAALVERAEALVARRDFAALLADPELVAVLSPPLLWRATVSLPEAPAGARFRLLIQEFERFEVDPETLALRRPGDPDPERRLVFAEALEITQQASTLPLSGGTAPAPRAPRRGGTTTRRRGGA